jgi:hypothetical protein
MFLTRLLVVGFVSSSLAGAAYLAREAETPGQKMTEAADKFLGALDAGQAKRASFGFDDKERFRWFFTPQQKDKKSTRLGLPLADMTADQRKLARALVVAGTSDVGYKDVATIMSLESILADFEKGRGPVRDPQWYFFTVFGKPTKTGRWGWRVEGHHLSLNFTVDAGKVVSATPSFFGANPAEVKNGKAKGLRPLPGAIDKFRALLDLLSAEEKKVAKQPKLFPEIEEAVKVPGVGKPVGLPAAKMNAPQKAALRKLIDVYADRMPPAVADHERTRINAAGLDTVHFAYGGSDAVEGKPYSYRVQGPTFVIEFVNEQSDAAKNPANHIHSAWRNIKGDFGLSAK